MEPLISLEVSDHFAELMYLTKYTAFSVLLLHLVREKNNSNFHALNLTAFSRKCVFFVGSLDGFLVWILNARMPQSNILKV